jgi:branched-chain amino acid transport system substrate-binding protein
MTSERWLRRLTLAATAIALALAGTACGDDEPAFRIGVVVDCVGIYRSLETAELSGAELPLIERDAEVAGRPVKLVRSCAEVWEFSALARELRHLAEDERVDAIVAGGVGPDSVVIRDIARKHSGVVFLAAVHGPREPTLRRTAPNLFRFSADHAQGVAGLGTYAYRELGWRRAAVALGNWEQGWQSRDAFVAEFCALGGRITKQIAPYFFDPLGRDARRIPSDVDGVALLSWAFHNPGGFLRRLAQRMGDPARRILAGPGVMDNPALLKRAGPALVGLTGTSYLNPGNMRRYLRAYARAFPGRPASLAGEELVRGYRDAVEALLNALERADGDTERVPAELRRLRLDLLGGPVRLDGNRQAVTDTSLVRLVRNGPGPPKVERLERIEAVDQSVGGLLSASRSPDSRPTGCPPEQRPPPWARH